jgi:hypothetical protein
MGKRELLIIASFLLAGLAVYHVTAPAPAGPGRRFSLSDVVSHVRREVRGNRATATVTSHNTLTIAPTVHEVRISGVVKLTVTGEDRPDLGYDLTVEAGGPDDAGARANGAQTRLLADDLGAVLSLRVAVPHDTRQVAQLTVHVPRRLAVRVEGASGSTDLDVTGVGALRLDSLVGDVRLSGVTGEVSGTHRNGDLTLDGAGSIALTLVSSKATFTGVRGTMAISARNGECRVDGSAGVLTMDATNENTILTNMRGPVQVTGTGGELHVDEPAAEVRVDMRRTAITIALQAASPVIALAAEAPLRVVLDGPPGILIDAAVAEDGEIRAGDFGLTAEPAGTGARLVHAFTAAGPRVVLRNERGAIEITERK